MRLLYGLDQLPASVAVDDERLPSMVLGVAPLRLNSEPVPQAFFPRARTNRPASRLFPPGWRQRAAPTRLTDAGSWRSTLPSQ